jgi:hypothetical protein
MIFTLRRHFYQEGLNFRVCVCVISAKNNFKCPICRRIVTLGDLENNIEAWVKSLPLNNLIVSMVDKQAMTQYTVHFDYFTVMFATIIYPTDT